MTVVLGESVRPKVSVCITAYNHVNYISQALDGVLAQQTDFAFEILVGEDGSADGTREIVQEYANQHPKIMRPFFNDRSNVIYINGNPSGRWNLVNLIEHARGEYVALLDGDDYWTDPQKLQLQADLLDSHHDCSFAFHNAMELDENTGRLQPFRGLALEGEAPQRIRDSGHGQVSEVGLQDLFFTWMVPTASIMFRNSMLEPFPEWYFRAISGDHMLQLLLARNGKALYLNRCMSVYRKHAGGVTLRHSSATVRRNWARMHYVFNRFFNYEYDHLLAGRLARDLQPPFSRFIARYLRALKISARGGIRPLLLLHWALIQRIHRRAGL